jgi:hypothetical protein
VHARQSAYEAVVIVDPVQCQRRPDEREDIPMPLRTLHFGRPDEGLVTLPVSQLRPGRYQRLPMAKMSA